MKKEKKGLPVWAWIIIGVVVIFVIYVQFASQDNSNASVQDIINRNAPSQNAQFIQANNTWSNLLGDTNNDISEINRIHNKYNPLTFENYPDFLAEISPRYTMYQEHLIAEKNFLAQYGSVFTNYAELKREVDNAIVEIQTSINQLNLATTRYNQAVANQQAEGQAMSDILKLLMSAI